MGKRTGFECTDHPHAYYRRIAKALDEGDLDAVAISYLGSSSTYRIIKEFSPMKMYIGMPIPHGAHEGTKQRLRRDYNRDA